MRKRHLFLAAALSFVLAGPARSQVISSNSSTAFPILSTGLGPRAVAMGESFTAIADDFSAVHYNPAGLAQVQQPELVLMHNSYLVDGFYENLGGLYPCGTSGTAALALNYLNYGSFEQRDNFGALTGSYTPFDLSAGGAFGFPVDKDISLGFNTQWIRQQIASVVHSGLLWDLGFMARPSERFSVGLDLKNLGVETGGYNLPAELLLGTAYRMSLAPRDLHSLLMSFEGDISFQGVSRVNLGFEYAFQHQYFLRGGYSLDTQDNQLGWSKGLDFGAGLRFGQLQFDYSFSFEGDLGNIQRFSLSIFLGAPVKPAKEAAAQSALPAPMPPAWLAPDFSLPNVPGATGVTTGAPVSTTANPNAAATTTAGNHPVMLKFQISSTDDLTPQQLFDQGEEKLKMGLKQEALDLYLKAVDKDPNFEPAWGRLGRLFFDKSLESYRKVLELNPQNDRLREWLKQFQSQ